MNTREIAKLACQLLALYFAIITLTSFANFVPSLFGPDDVAFLVVWHSTNILVYGGVSLALWRYAERTSSWLVPDSSKIEFGDASFQKVQRLAFSVVGLIFAIQGISELLQTVTFNLTNQGITNAWERSISSTVKLVLGTLLLVGGDSLTGFFGKLEQNRISHNDVQSDAEKS